MGCTYFAKTFWIQKPLKFLRTQRTIKERIRYIWKFIYKKCKVYLKILESGECCTCVEHRGLKKSCDHLKGYKNEKFLNFCRIVELSTASIKNGLLSKICLYVIFFTIEGFKSFQKLIYSSVYVVPRLCLVLEKN